MSRGASFWVGRLLGWASTVCCLVVLGSFAIFVVNQTSAASSHQQRELTGGGSIQSPANGAPQPSAGASTEAGTSASSSASGTQHEGTVHRVIDEVAGELTSPFSQLTSSSHSQWVVEGAGTLLALLLYGVLLRYLVRVLHLRV